MKSFAIFLLFIGTILVIQGYYSQSYDPSKFQKTHIKYVPRSHYEDQLGEENIDQYYKGIFDSENIKK